jgi:crotonobetainyl-CoA:carnitine CoA-transferase CaiB-like acyl-CoA transferase
MTDETDTTGYPGWGALRGVRILDLSVLLPGPFATEILADLGADVVKVEPPKGDNARHMPMEMFRMANRNKRSICLDLKNPASRPAIVALALWADVVVEGFRPGVTERLGVSWAQLSEINERLVYCSISGYGQSGPSRLLPGHDLNYMAAGGALSLKGRWLDDKPARSGLPVSDVAGSSFAVITILSALLKRERDGKGSYIDVALADAALSFTALRRGLDIDDPERLHLYPTNDLFETADGRTIVLGLVEDEFWQNFRRLLAGEAPELGDARYDDETSRRRHGDELSRALAAVMRRRTGGEWLELLSPHNIPVQLVLTPREAAQSAQVRHRRIVRSIDGESHIPFPVLVDGEPAGAARTGAPGKGQHGRQILAELGLSEEQITAALATGEVGA